MPFSQMIPASPSPSESKSPFYTSVSLLYIWSYIYVFKHFDSVQPHGQAPLSMGFPKQEYWSSLTFLSPGDLPDPGIEPRSPPL